MEFIPFVTILAMKLKNTFSMQSTWKECKLNLGTFYAPTKIQLPTKWHYYENRILMNFWNKTIHQSFARIFKMGAWKLTQPHSTLNAIVEVDHHMKDYGKSSLYQFLAYSSLELAKETYTPNLSWFTNVRNHSQGLIVKTIIWNFLENRYIPIKKWQMTIKGKLQ